MAFPTTAVFDTAARADGGPPPGPGWGSLQLLFDSFPMQLVASAFRGTGAGGCSAYWAAGTGSDCQVYATTVAVGGYARLFARMVNPGTSSASGYQLQASWYGEDTWRLSRIDNERATDIATVSAPDPAPGDRIGLECVGSTIRGYWFHDGAWEQILTATDTTYSAGGVIGIGADWSNTTFRDIGGGTQPAMGAGAGSRHFNGTTDDIRFAITSPNPTAAITLLVVVRHTARGDASYFSADVNIPEFGRGSSETLYYANGIANVNGSAATNPPLGSWCVAAVTKASGSVRPRMHCIPIGGAPAHEPANASSGDVTARTNWFVGSDGGGFRSPEQIAAWAIWNRALSDAEIERCVTWEGTVALAPAKAVRLDGDPPFDTQLSISGTTHSALEPAGFWPAAGATIASYQGGAWADSPLRTYDGSAWRQAAGVGVL